MWPSKVCRGTDVLVSHSLADLSCDEVRTWYSECADQAMLVTQSVWELKVFTPCETGKVLGSLSETTVQHTTIRVSTIQVNT